MRKRGYQTLLCLTLALTVLLSGGCSGQTEDAANTAAQDASQTTEAAAETAGGEDPAEANAAALRDPAAEGSEEEISEPKELTLWYTQPDLEPYFTEAAVAYEAETGTKVTAVQVPALDYIETINSRSVETSEYPDLYVVTPDLLEKAKLAGLTMKVQEDAAASADFSGKAWDAVTYKGEQIAYPFYTDTSVLIYNKNYVQEAPATIEDIQTFSEAFEGDGSIQNIFVWNVNDIFVDFFTIGNYVNLGGVCGDSLEEIVLNSEKIRSCLSVYQALNQFFAIDKELVSEETILQDFAEGKTIYAIIRDDSLEALDAKIAETAGSEDTGAEDGTAEEGADAENEWDTAVSYGIAQVPDLTADLQVRPLSVTHSIAVNGYTEEPAEAARFASFLTVTYADRLYEASGNFPARTGITYANPELVQVAAQYEEAVEVPKVMQMSNYWLLMEPAFSSIWTGADVTEVMAQAEAEMNVALGR